MICIERLATLFSILIAIAFFPLSLFFCIAIIREYQRAVIFRMGKLRSGGARGPGTFCILPCIDDFTVVDLRTVAFDVPPQEAITKDAVSVSVNAVVFYRVKNPLYAVTKIADYSDSTKLLAMTTLRNIIGTKQLSDLLSDREKISRLLQENLEESTDEWGITVERVEIKDAMLPEQLQRAMAAEAEASREAKAKLISAEGELKSSRALKQAADIINQSNSALQLRYLQTLKDVAVGKETTIIYPIPIEMFKHLKQKL